ncbi:MAG: hypothetical protein HYV63_17660 [Candidatus Schekmanbacteria bacterium]|nr:hypothetical protein [Candidatus Schekmanbacteria bacterium]
MNDDGTSGGTRDVSGLTLDDLRACRLQELESLYASAPLAEMPRGIFAGEVLADVDSAAAKETAMRLMVFLGFRLPRFGVDFDRFCWYFGYPCFAAGHFRVAAGTSRWRETAALQLHYDPSRLPQVIRGRLYDEVKPLSAALCLGLGGVNAARGRGDLFFFALSRRA